MKQLSIIFAFALITSITGIGTAADSSSAGISHPDFKADLSGAKVPPVPTAATGEAIFDLVGPGKTGAGTGGPGGDTTTGPKTGVDAGDITTGMAGPGLGEGQGSGAGGVGQTSDPGSYKGIIDKDKAESGAAPGGTGELDTRRNYSSSEAFSGAFPESSGAGAGGSTKGSALRYELKVDDIENVTAAHLHTGKRTSIEGPVVASLFLGPKKSGEFSGTLAQGMITDKDLAGPLKGKKVDDLVRMMKDGDIYVNVHTDRHPAGEIRGQVKDIS